jgi:magnesium-transporting ATPase (P-type)
VILADDMFSTIAFAVREGRAVYQNLQKIILFNLPTNFAQGLSIVLAIAIGMEAPLESMQVLTVNMLTGVSLGIVLALEPRRAYVALEADELLASRGPGTGPGRRRVIAGHFGRRVLWPAVAQPDRDRQRDAGGATVEVLPAAVRHYRDRPAPELRLEPQGRAQSSHE